MFIGRIDAKAEAPVFWPPHAKSWLIGKDSDAGRDWGQEEKGMTEDEMAEWHHRLDGHEFEWTPVLVMDREAWHAAMHGVAKSRTQLSDWTELNWMANKNGWTFFPVFTGNFHTPSLRLLVRRLESLFTVVLKVWSLPSTHTHTHTHTHTQTHTHTHTHPYPRPYPRSPESEVLKVGPRNLCFNKLSKWLQTLKFWRSSKNQ